MSSIAPVFGLPGVRAAVTATHRLVFKGGWEPTLLPQGKIINGTASRDPLNAGDLDVLRAGVLMGKRTSDSFYAPSIIGTLTVAGTVGNTSMTVGAATAVEIARRQGTSGTFKVTGPPAANGIVVTETVTYSAINTTTGVATVTATTNAFVSGSFVTPTDGSETPLTLIPDGYGYKVTDNAGANINVPFPELPIAGLIQSSQIINWSSDTSLRAWIVARLNDASGGQFVFDHIY